MKIILTGDRPTGHLHLGHYVGSLKNRVELQNEDKYNMYVMIADAQALTDNFDNPKKVRENVLNVALDYLSVGIDPKKVNIFIQSEVSELTELTFYYMNLVTLSRLERNPTVKNEIKQKGFEKSIPVGFLTYPVSQTADITAFKANLIPVGNDQLPMIEQANEIVSSFNRIYNKEVLVKSEALLPKNELSQRLPGLDGKAKMSKSLGNCIYLCDNSEDVYKKVMSMYTDPDHIKVDDPGKVDGNVVFMYLDVFSNDELIKKYSDFNSLQEMKEKYTQGGLGDVVIKKVLYNILEEVLSPIREKRKYYEENIDKVKEILKEGTINARKVASNTLKEVKEAIGINYFE